jgi:hypothetical protein
MPTKCQCESSVCGQHGTGSCANTATREVPTIYGKYLMCRKCAEALPANFKKAGDKMKKTKDEVQPVDVEQAVALKKHEDGVTKSQDRGKRARDLKSTKSEAYEYALKKGATESEAERFAASYERASTNIGVREFASRTMSFKKAKDTELPVPIKTSNLVPMPSGEHNEVRYAPRRAGDAEKTYYVPIDGKTYTVRAASEKAAKALAQAQHSQAGLGTRRTGDAKSEADRLEEGPYQRLAMAVESAREKFKRASREERDRYDLEEKWNKAEEALTALENRIKNLRKSEKAGDAKPNTIHPDMGPNAAKNWEPFVEKLKANIDMSRDARVRRMNQEMYDDAKRALEGLRNSKDERSFNMWADSLRMAKRKATDSKRATDSLATLPIERSGSEPADHMARAARYEVQGDRARALDSYRAAASGYRTAADGANEAKARDGIAACQAKFATQYDHPGRGRVKVCDSASNAMRTAVERTRAGEAVSVVGTTVRPGRARAKDVQGESYKDRQLRELKEQYGSRYSDKILREAVKTGREPWSLGTKEKHKPAKDDTGGPEQKDNPSDPEDPSPVPTGDTADIKDLERRVEEAKQAFARGSGTGVAARLKNAERELASARATNAKEVQPVPISDEFEESSHPRAENGQFGAGAGSASPAKASKSGAVPTDRKAALAKLKNLQNNDYQKLANKVDTARDRYKSATREQRDRQGLEKKWNKAEADLTALEGHMHEYEKVHKGISNEI